MPLKQFKCSICGASCPKEYLKHGGLAKRMSWLRKHREKHHPKAFRVSVKKSIATRKR